MEKKKIIANTIYAARRLHSELIWLSACEDVDQSRICRLLESNYAVIKSLEAEKGGKK